MTLVLYSLTALLLGLSLIIVTFPSRNRNAKAKEAEATDAEEMLAETHYDFEEEDDVTIGYEDTIYSEADEYREQGDVDLYIPPREPSWIEDFDPHEDTIYMSVDGTRPLPVLSFEDLDGDGVVLANGTPVLVVRNAAGLLDENSIAFTTSVFEVSPEPHQH